jgi:hypothetical protein
MLWALIFGSAGWVPASAQSVISTHSGTVYFFDGSVYLGGQRLEQRFGRFPDIGEGHALRTEQGRAEILLTPGTLLRVGESSEIRLLSSKFSDTRVELLGGSAIMEANEPAKETAVTLVHKDWQVRLLREGVYRMDTELPKVTVYKGDINVSATGDPNKLTVHQGQTLPLASVLVPMDSLADTADEFKSWAMSRSQAVSSDNATAAGIIDNPDAIDNSAGMVAGLSYFPLTGIPGVAITNPYGLSFWSPFQSTLSSIYLPPYSYGLLYPVGWPTPIRYHLWRLPGSVLNRPPNSVGSHPGGHASPLPPHSPPGRTVHPVTPHPGAAHAGGHR